MEKKSNKSKTTARRKINNRPRKAPVNVFPESETLDLESLGDAGAQIGVERALRHLHDFGDGIWREIGVSKRKLNRYAPQVVGALRRITLDADASRTLNRSGAMALYGELGGIDALRDLCWVLESESEKTATRGWAAWAIGRAGGDAAANILISSLKDSSSVVRRQVIEALGQTRSKLAVEALRETARRDKDPVISSLAYSRARKMEKQLRMKPVSIKFRSIKARKRKSKTSRPPD